MRKKLLLSLAEHLSTVDPAKYNMTDYHKDALFYAAHVPAIKKAGLRLVTRANEPGGVITAYKGAVGLSSASLCFEISDIHAEYLFGVYEVDIWGGAQDAPFGSDRNYHGIGLRRGRENEPPTWTADRIKCYVKDANADYLGREPKEAA